MLVRLGILTLAHLLFSSQVKCCKNITEVVAKMTRPTVLITHNDVPEIAITLLKKDCNLVVLEQQPYPTPEDIKARIKGVDGLFWVSKFRLDKDILDAAGPQLKTIATMSAGVNNLDVDLIKSRGITLGNTPNVVSDATANIAILLALAAGRRIQEGRNAILDETWVFGPQWLLGYDLSHSVVGIIGLGGIGQAIARRARAFDVDEILYTGHKEKKEGVELGARFVDLNALLSRSDFVFVAAPLTNETRGMFDFDAFAKMKRTAVFVNISRGEVVKQEDLIRALREKTIFAAGLDVMTPEPLPKDHELLKLPNCILVPHIGTATYRARAEMAELTAKNLLFGLKGEPMLAPV